MKGTPSTACVGQFTLKKNTNSFNFLVVPAQRTDKGVPPRFILNYIIYIIHILDLQGCVQLIGSTPTVGAVAASRDRFPASCQIYIFWLNQNTCQSVLQINETEARLLTLILEVTFHVPVIVFNIITTSVFLQKQE